MYKNFVSVVNMNTSVSYFESLSTKKKVNSRKIQQLGAETSTMAVYRICELRDKIGNSSQRA